MDWEPSERFNYTFQQFGSFAVGAISSGIQMYSDHCPYKYYTCEFA